MGNASWIEQAIPLLPGMAQPETASGFMGWALVAALALGAMLVIGRPMIAWLKGMPGMKWSAREDTPDTHLLKKGTPSMGGVGIIAAALVAFFAAAGLAAAGAVTAARLTMAEALTVIALLPAYVFLHMVLGWVDDKSKAAGRGGLRARDKFLGQCLLSALFLFAVAARIELPSAQYLLQHGPPMATWLLFGGLMIFLLGTCNAVNITDGIDGLSAGLAVQFGVAIGLATLWNGFGLLWAALTGACLGFLTFNRYPARVFMGDTGSLALGAAVGGVAVLTNTVLLLPFIGFIFYVELLSVTTQVLYFKWTRKTAGEGKRLFRRAPLHHHFELGGWSEWRVVGMFWLVNLVTSAIGLVLWKQGYIPRFP